MPNTRIRDKWESLVKNTVADHRKWGPALILRDLKVKAEKLGMGDDYPSPRTIARIKDDMKPEDVKAYSSFRWPESMEEGALPWEAAPSGLELLRLHRWGLPLEMITNRKVEGHHLQMITNSKEEGRHMQMVPGWMSLASYEGITFRDITNREALWYWRISQATEDSGVRQLSLDQLARPLGEKIRKATSEEYIEGDIDQSLEEDIRGGLDEFEGVRQWQILKWLCAFLLSEGAIDEVRRFIEATIIQAPEGPADIRVSVERLLIMTKSVGGFPGLLLVQQGTDTKETEESDNDKA